jgi:two-component system NtrC family sensor kinase
MSSQADLPTPNAPMLPSNGSKGRQAGMFDELEELEDEAAERALDMSTQAAINLPTSNRLVELISSLRIKLVVPYVFLTLITAMIGTFVVTRLVTSSVRERFANQLLEAGRVASDGIVRRERTHLETLRLMAFTQGVPEAIAAEDPDQLQQLLYPLVVNANANFLTAINAQGQEIISLVQDPETGSYAISEGGDLSTLEIVSKPLKGEEDVLGDKFAGLIQTVHGPYLATTVPVRGSDGSVVGVLMLGTKLDTLLDDLKTQALADLTALDQTGSVMVSTLAEPEEGFGILNLTPYQVGALDPAIEREVTMYDRRFQVLYAPLMVRQEPVGVLGVALPSNFIVTTEATSRNLFSLIFSLGTVAVIVVGYLLSQSVARPILRVRDVSLAVASGDLGQKTGIERKDEIGQLAAVFDLMTFRLRRRTAQAARLTAETIERNKELADANTRLQVAQQQLVQSEKLASVGQLTAGIVHDVKNPLGVIKGLAEEVEEQVSGDQEVVSQLKLIRDSAVRANTIVSDLLKFARQSNPELSYQNICATVETSARLTDYLARKAGVKVSTELPASGVMAFYDAQLIEQVLINLIQNAIQAMPKGGSLRLRVAQKDDWVETSVQDTGTGIKKENLSRIFDPFFTTKPPGEGTGLGLSVSYGIVAQHGGEILVDSKVGKGTTFTIRLPRTRAQSEALVAAQASSP